MTKLPSLNTARINIEILKRLFRILHDINIIRPDKYIEIELDLEEISRMTNGWITYIKAAR